MRCAKVRTLLDDHVDGLLPADRSGAVRAHLDSCSACDQEFELLRGATAPLSAWGDLAPPPGCFERILARIEALPPEMHMPAATPAQPSLRFLRGGARWLVTSGAVAAAVLVAAIAVERAGDGDATKSPQGRAERPIPVAAGVGTVGTGTVGTGTVGTGTVGTGTGLKPGEIALTRTRFRVTERLERRDGLRRRRERGRPEIPGVLSIPVSAGPLGAGPR